MDIIFELNEGLPQQGPGLNESTLQALAVFSSLPKRPKILDMGCGNGRQTIAIVKATSGDATAVDVHQPFLNELAARAKAQSLSKQIVPLKGSLSELSLPEKSFDLIWSEGAIYVFGFKSGLETWKKYLKPGGFLAVTECSWLEENPPEDLREFWQEGYPEMKDVESNIKIIKETGLELLHHFTLPEKGWWNYYKPIQKRIGALWKKYEKSTTALEVLQAQEREIDLYRKYSRYYGYVFYCMKG